MVQARARALGLLFLLAACGDSGGGSDVPDACNPLGDGASCLAPWPSSAYLADDSSTTSGAARIVRSTPGSRESGRAYPLSSLP